MTKTLKTFLEEAAETDPVGKTHKEFVKFVKDVKPSTASKLLDYRVGDAAHSAAWEKRQDKDGSRIQKAIEDSNKQVSASKEARKLYKPSDVEYHQHSNRIAYHQHRAKLLAKN